MAFNVTYILQIRQIENSYGKCFNIAVTVFLSFELISHINMISVSL